MERFELNILGCGSATPTPRHNPSGQVVNFRDNLLMIDCGEGSQRMFRQMQLKFSRLNHIFISHMHGDHCLGVPGLLSTLALHERTGQLTVHLPAEGLKIMKDVVDYFCRKVDYDIVFNPIEGDGGVVLDTPGLIVEAFPLYHRITCYGYVMREKPKLRHLRGDMVEFHKIPVSALHGIKCGEDFTMADGRVIPNAVLTTDPDPARSYAYCSDTMFDARVAEAVKGVDVLYHEATYDESQAVKARERGHSTAAEAGRIAAMAGVGRLVIGHYSKRYLDSEVLAEEARREFPNVIAANEGMVVNI